MSYSIIPLIALFVHAIINYDIFQKNNPLALKRSFRSYRFFLISAFVFFLCDTLWGIFFFQFKLEIASYIVTYIFFYIMSITVFSWTRYVIDYLTNYNIFTKILTVIGWVFIGAVIVVLGVNIFFPILFAFNDGDYITKLGREIYFYSQIALFFLISLYSLIYCFVKKEKEHRAKFFAIAIFGIMMCVSIGAQIAYPFSPIYSAGLLIGLTIVRLFITNEERNDFYRVLQESQEREDKSQSELSSTKEMVYVDILTGAKSKYAYVELEDNIDTLIAHHEIDHFSVAVIDLNDLKYINDKLGHDEGDRYLKESVALVKAFFPDVDLYRFGGDEFVLFISDVSYENRHEIVEAFNQHIEANFAKGEPILSIGLADFIPDRDNTYRSVFERADKRMYLRKDQLKRIGTIDIVKFAKNKKHADGDNSIIENIVLKAQDSLKKSNDPRIAFYKNFYYSETLPLIDLLNNSSCDEIVEVNLAKDTFKQLYHVDGKYFVPTVEVSYKALYDFTMDYIIHPEDKAIYSALMDPDGFFERLKNSEIPNFNYAHFRYRLQDGNYRYVEQVVITGEENGIAEGLFRLYVFDIHNLKARQLGYSSDDRDVISRGRDQVTNLLLEKEFLKKAKNLIDHNPEKNWCLISIDIEHFRFFDEWYGRETGDYLLAKIGSTLSEAETDLEGLSGYFGKDDFTLLIPYDEQKINDIYESIRKIILSFGLSAGFMPAFGIAMIEKDLALVDAFDRSTIAVAKAKSDFRHHICVYDSEMQFLTVKEHRILSEFMNALKNDEITFYLQPQCRISSKRIVGAEALARWIKKDGSFISPAEYIPVLEKYGFVTDLDQHMWEIVCKWIKNRLDNHLPIVPISVNVSRVDIFSIDIAKEFHELTEKYQIPHNLLKIEITESAYADNTSYIDELVRTLKKDGFMVLMDDFGSGYSSLNMLSNISIDAIKLDTKFLHLNGEDEKSIHILESVVNMAKLIALPIIVEGVENKKQCDFLEGLGCRYIQGFYFYKPMSNDDFAKVIEGENIIDDRGFVVKLNEQFRIREFLDRNVYSDSMLNNIIGPVAFYSWHGDHTDIVRFNEQFYKVVSVPDFADRLNDIERFLYPEDIVKMHEAFKKAMNNRLTGHTERLRFYRTDGSISNFDIHFYYLGNKEGGERFYGSAIDVTELTFLKDQVNIFSDYSNDNLIFVRRINDKWCFTVAANGLSEVFHLPTDVIEEEINNGKSKNHFVKKDDYKVMMDAMEKAYQEKKGFTQDFDFYDANNNIVSLHLLFIRVGDLDSNIQYIINSKVIKK